MSDLCLTLLGAGDAELVSYNPRIGRFLETSAQKTGVIPRAGNTESFNPEPTATEVVYAQLRRRWLRVKRKCLNPDRARHN